VQPSEFVTVSVTVKVPPFVYAWDTLGLAGKLMVTGALPSPKFQTQVVIYPCGEKERSVKLIESPWQAGEL
jgi:hypothetical protein